MRLRHVMLTAATAMLALPAFAQTPPGCTSVNVVNSPLYKNGGTYFVCPVETSQFKNALCNDGSPGVFQVQPSATHSTTWVIWLEGGYECTDQTTCEQRATNPKLVGNVTSTGFKPRQGHGVLSHDQTLNPALANANRVVVHYCSSDLWSGSHRPADNPTFSADDLSTWRFEGRAIAKGAIGTLKNLKLGFGAATRVLLGGTSSGTYGAAVNVNDFLPILPPHAQLSLLLDAGFTLDIGPFNAALRPPFVDTSVPTPFYSVVSAGIPLWQARGDAVCNAQATTLQAQVECYNTADLLFDGDLAVPTFVAESLIDSAELPGQLCPANGGNCGVPRNPATKKGKYVTYYGQQMATLISGNGAGSLPYTAFAPDQYEHPFLDEDQQFIEPFQFESGSLVMRDVFDAWLANQASAGSVIVGTGPGVQ